MQEFEQHFRLAAETVRARKRLFELPGIEKSRRGIQLGGDLEATRGGGVATHSLHMDGKAIDIRIPGVALTDLRDAAVERAAPSRHVGEDRRRDAAFAVPLLFGVF